MSNEVVTNDARASRAGMSRRQLIKRAAATGAVAWTAPLVIESLASPAGATVSGCTKRYVKLSKFSLGCFDACTAAPASAVDSDAFCAYNHQTCCDCTDTALCPTMVLQVSAPYTDYYKIELQPTKASAGSPCFFSSIPAWQVEARYGGSGPAGSDYVVAVPAGSGIPTGVGYNVLGGTTLYVYKEHTISGTTKNLSYVYVQYCCSDKAPTC